MNDKVRVHEIAKELGIVSKEVVEKANAMGMSLKTASSSVSMEEAEKIMNYIMNPEAVEPKAKKVTVKKAAPKVEADTAPEVEAKPVTEAVKVESEPVKEAPAVSTEDKKPEEAKVEEPVTAVEAPKEVKVNKNLAAIKVVAPKRKSGLRIVKKKKPKVEEDYSIKTDNAAAVSSYGKMSAEALEELASKKNRRRSNSPAQRKESGRSMNIFAGGMADVSMDYDDNEVVLLDLTQLDNKPPPAEEQRKPRPKKPAGRNAGKKQGGNRKPRQVSRDKRKNMLKLQLKMRL